MTKRFVNHWGIWVDPSKPITGVIALNQVSQFVGDQISMSNAIDLAYIEAKNEFIREFQNKIAKETGIFRMPTDQELEEFNNEVEDLQGDWLIGSWKLDQFGKYEHDEDGEFSAIVREDVVQVIWSKYVTKCSNLCSPCYPGQADVNGGEDEPGGKFLAFNLPPSAYGNINYYICPECNLELSPTRIEGSIYHYECKTCGKKYSHNEDKPEFPFGEFDNGKHWQLLS